MCGCRTGVGKGRVVFVHGAAEELRVQCGESRAHGGGMGGVVRGQHQRVRAHVRHPLQPRLK
jgi:hypothetical protein